MVLAVILDWYSRCVLSWKVSNTLEGSFCREILEEALGKDKPLIFNTDQGAQFTRILKDAQVQISTDGRGRALGNIFVERLWPTVKYEHVHHHGYENGRNLIRGLTTYFNHYNNTRPHQSLGYQKPAEVYRTKVA